MWKRPRLLGQPLVFAVAAVLLGVASATFAAELTHPLTADQVACDEQQLQRLEKRFVVNEDIPGIVGGTPLGFGNPSLFVWRSSAAGGVYSGLGVTGDGMHRASAGNRVRSEEQLA